MVPCKYGDHPLPDNTCAHVSHRFVHRQVLRADACRRDPGGVAGRPSRSSALTKAAFRRTVSTLYGWQPAAALPRSDFLVAVEPRGSVP